MTQAAANEQARRRTVETSIQEVTVYTNRAQVTRRGRVELKGEEGELVLTGLPMTLQTESLRAGGVGTVGVRLLGVRAELVYATEPVEEKVAQLTRQIRQLQEQRRAVQDAIEALLLQRGFVLGLGDKAVERFSQGLARQSVSLDETASLLDFLGRQHGQYATTLAERERERDELDRQIQALQQQLKLISNPRSTQSYSLIAAIEPAGAGQFELEITYTVQQASWTPLYDLRVSSADKTVNLSYLAEVNQHTGEDWSGVTLTLSTAKPGLGTLPPHLDPWYIDVLRPMPPMMPMAMAMGGAMSATPAPEAFRKRSLQSESFGAADTAEQLFEAQSVAAEVSSEGGVVTFRLDRNSDIPSDGAPHKITIFSDNYPSRVEYIAMPKLVSFAYLQATITNSASGATLLPGAANIFRNNTFVGTTHLENIAPGQEFKLNLGIDESIKIERDLVEREVDKKFMSGQRRTTYAYRLAITNLRDDEATLRLSEQLPVSRNEQIKVKLTRSTPPVQPGEMGLLEWLLPLPPKAKREVYYQFTIEHPTDLNITGLGI